MTNCDKLILESETENNNAFNTKRFISMNFIYCIGKEYEKCANKLKANPKLYKPLLFIANHKFGKSSKLTIKINREKSKPNLSLNLQSKLSYNLLGDQARNYINNIHTDKSVTNLKNHIKN